MIGLRIREESSDGGDDVGKLVVVLGDPGVEFVETSRESLVVREDLAQPNEGADDGDAHLDRGGAVEDISSLDGAVLREGEGAITPSTAIST